MNQRLRTGYTRRKGDDNQHIVWQPYTAITYFLSLTEGQAIFSIGCGSALEITYRLCNRKTRDSQYMVCQLFDDVTYSLSVVERETGVNTYLHYSRQRRTPCWRGTISISVCRLPFNNGHVPWVATYSRNMRDDQSAYSSANNRWHYILSVDWDKVHGQHTNQHPSNRSTYTLSVIERQTVSMSFCRELSRTGCERSEKWGAVSMRLLQ